MSWVTPGEDEMVRTIIHDDEGTGKIPAQSWAVELKAKLQVRVFVCGGQMDHALMMAGWGRHQWVNMGVNGGPTSVIWAMDG